jgi:hypothetical protein
MTRRESFPPEGQEMFKHGLHAMLERMTRAGWLESARNKQNFVIRWTELGAEAATEFGILFDKLGPDLSAHELIALLHILDSMSPGGTDSESNSLE